MQTALLRRCIHVLRFIGNTEEGAFEADAFRGIYILSFAISHVLQPSFSAYTIGYSYSLSKSTLCNISRTAFACWLVKSHRENLRLKQ